MIPKSSASFKAASLDFSPKSWAVKSITFPAGFCRVRSAGFLAGRVRKKSLELIYTLLDKIYEPSEVKSMSEAELILHFFEKDVSICTDCGSKVEILPRMSRRSAALYIRGMPAL